MNSRNTFLWVFIAAALLGLILLQHHFRRAPAGLPRILPGFEAAAVSSLEVRPASPGDWEIRAERTNGSWSLTAPLAYPAQAASIERLLAVLAELTPALSIPAADMLRRPNADEEFGLTTARATSLILQQGDVRTHLLVGARTAPGDQVYLQVVGSNGACVVDASLLQALPRSANDWRDTALANFKGFVIDRVALTNNAKNFSPPREAATLALQRDSTNHLWRMVRPMEARADSAKVQEAVERLQELRVERFVSDDPKTDLEALGLQPPALELTLAQGTNTVAQLQFGKSPTNAPSQVFARRLGQGSIVTVSKDLLAPWLIANVNDFREPRLLALAERVDAVEVFGQDAFSLQRQTNNTWRIQPQNWPADATLVRDLVATLGDFPVEEFSRDIVTAADLPEYGLAAPLRRFVLQTVQPAPAGGTTNVVIADLSFGGGTNHPGKLFARRTDEASIYAVSTNDFQRLPWVSWQLRARKFWNFAEEDIASVTIRQQGKTRQILHQGPHQWALARGFQGAINDLAVDSTAAELADLSAAWWIGRGESERARLGFTDAGFHLTIELKNGEKAALEFGGLTPAGVPLAATMLDGEAWIFEFPTDIAAHVVRYLAIP